MSSINERINYLLAKFGDSSPTKFGDLIGATPQYVAKISKEGGSVGLEPVIKILRALPDINARWLILGEGDPVDRKIREEQISKGIGLTLKRLALLDRYVPAMSADELDEIGKSLSGGSFPNIREEQLAEWEEKINARERAVQDLIKKSMEEGIVCRTKKAKK